MYKVMLIQEGGNLQEAYDTLLSSESRIVDKLAAREQQAVLQLQLGMNAEAEAIYRSLLLINPENHEYHSGLMKACCLGPVDGKTAWTAEQQQQLVGEYEKLAKEFPKSNAVLRIPLDHLDGDLFVQRMDSYVRPFVRKGIPSLFSDIKPLYKNAAKVELLEGLFLRCCAALFEPL